MIRFGFRFLAAVALAIAVVMAVLDATRSVAADAIVLTPLGKSWMNLAPAALETIQSGISDRLHPALWNHVALPVLNLPGFVVFLLLALLFHVLGRRRHRFDEPLPERA
jgi:hypothetical protein